MRTSKNTKQRLYVLEFRHRKPINLYVMNECNLNLIRQYPRLATLKRWLSTNNITCELI